MGYCDDVETKTNSCKTNFLNSITKFGLGVENLNDNTINLFEKFTCTPDGNLLHYPSESKKRRLHHIFKSCRFISLGFFMSLSRFDRRIV